MLINDPIMLAIGRLEGKMDAILRGQTRLEDVIDRHDARIRKLEHHKALQIGGAATIGALASLMVNVFWNRQP